MTDKDFIIGIYESVINENNSIYYDMFTKANIDEAKNTYWKEAVRFFSNLSDEDKVIFFKILRQITIDTVSNILGILDGVSTIEGYDGFFKLLIEGNDTPINGDLLDLFLGYIEDNC